jgi:hypothetical protein
MFCTNTCYSIKILGVDIKSDIPKKGFVGKTFFIYFTKKSVHKLGFDYEIFDLKIYKKGKYVYTKTVCRCDEHDVFKTKTPIKDEDTDSFTTTATIIVPHDDEKDFVKGTLIKILASKIPHIKNLKQAKEYVLKTI